MLDKILTAISNVKEIEGLNAETKLFDGLLDSFDLLTLISELEDATEISIPGECLLPENFETPNKIEKLILKLDSE